MEIMSRNAAAQIGSYKYFTGEPCKHGHVAPRYTKTCVCTECHKAANAKTMTRLSLALQGIRAVTVTSHLDDHPAIRAYADMLNLQRGLSVTQPGAPAAATPPPQPATISDDKLLAMRTAAHGPEIASTLMAQRRNAMGLRDSEN